MSRSATRASRSHSRRRPQRATRRGAHRPILDVLESRTLLAINVAVVGGTFNDSGLNAIVAQLNNDTYFDFNAVLVNPTQVDTLAELNTYDAVVVGSSGLSGDRNPFTNSAFTSALRTWVEAGGGLVATGWTVFAAGPSTGTPIADVNAVVPVNTAVSYGFYGAGSTLTPSSSHPVVAGVSAFTIGSSNYIEFSQGGADLGASVLATTNGTPVVVAGSVGVGRSVYLGPIYAGTTSNYNTSELRSGPADRLLEQAVAWASDADATPPSVVATNPGDGGTVNAPSISSLVVTFSEPVSAATAQDVANYRLTGPTGQIVPIASATLNGAGTAVTLAFSAQAAGGSYRLAVGNVADLAGNRMAPHTGYEATPDVYTTANSPLSSTTGDFTGDGLTDLVVQNYYTSTLTLFRGLGGGAFDNGTTLSGVSSGAFTKEIHSADLNGDGHLDLILAENGPGAIVLFGLGNGQFSSRQSFAVGGYTYALAVADLNGDGRLDVVMADQNYYLIRSFLNNGTSNLASWPVLTSSGPAVTDISLVDLNGDGRLDVVGTNFNSSVSVWLAAGSPGQFAFSHSVNSVNSAEHNVVADVDGDGIPDFVAGPHGGTIVYGTAGMPYFGTSAQSLGTSPSIWTTNVQVVDLDGDGDLDIVKGGWGGGALFLSFNQGGRSFSNQTIPLSSFGADAIWQLQTPDLNGDGLPELIATSYNTNRVLVLRSRINTVSTFTLVPNRPPVAANDSLTIVEDAGATAVDVLANDSDPDLDDLVITSVTQGTRGTVAIAADGKSLTYTPLANQNGADSFTYTISDGRGGSSTGDVSVAITPVNDPPTVSRVYASVTVDEGQSAGNSGSFDDLDGDTVTLTASVGTITRVGTSSGTWTWSYGTTDGPSQGQTVTITASDGNGGLASVAFDLIVNNLPPSATFNAPSTALEGSTVSVSLTNPSDPSAADAAAGFTYAFDFGAGYGAWSTGSAASFVPPDDGVYVLKGKIRDKDGGEREYTGTLTVANVAPTLTISGASSVNEGSTYTLNLAASDPGADTIQSWVINWGDGSAPETLPGNATTATHVYADGPRNFTILATATDEDGTYSATATGTNARASLDPSFANGGESIRNFDGDTADYIQSLTVVQPDGKVLVAGYLSGGITRMALARYNKLDGSLDTSFGNGGTTITEFGTYAQPRSLVLDDAGNILVGGSFGIARYSPDGVLDLNFGNGGRLTSFTGVIKLVRDAEGRLIAGNGSQFARFLPDGTADLSFGQGQSGVTAYLGYSYNDFAVMPDGKLVTVQSRYNGNVVDRYDIIVRRHLTSGQLDPSFGSAGQFQYDDGGFSGLASRVELQQGKVLVGGNLEELAPNPTNPGSFQLTRRSILFFRLADDGQGLDAGFGGGGTVLYRHYASQGAQYDYLYNFGVDPTGRIVVSGSYGQYRLSATGQPDAGFGTQGLATRYVSPFSGGGIVFGGQGEIYLGGFDSTSQLGANFALERWSDAGVHDNAFNGGVGSGLLYVRTAFTGPLSDTIQHVAVTLPDGKILVVGQTSGGNSELILARHLPDGQLDTSYGGGTGINRTGIFGGVTAAVAAADGTVYVALGSTIARFLPSGLIDTTTPSNGFGPTGRRAAEGMYVQGLALDGAGNLFALGYRYQPFRNPDGSLDTSRYSYDIVVGRFSTAGVLDTSYGYSGLSTLDLNNTATVRGDQFPFALAVDAAGRAVVTGYTYDVNLSTGQSSNFQGLIARFKADGTGLDPTFNPAGNGLLLTSGADGSTYPRQITLDGNGRLVVSFSTAVHRYNADGSPDLTFNGTGSSLISGSSIQALRIDGQGRIVVGGSNFLGRFTAGGALDTNFGPSGRITFTGRVVSSIALDAGNRVLAAGSASDGGANGNDFWLARYINEGLAVTVNNVSPQNLSISGPTSAVEGATISLTASATDPAGENDPLTFNWNIYRNGNLYLQVSGSSISFLVSDNGNFSAILTVTDGDGGSASLSRSITVTNVAPTATFNAPSSATEGSAFTVSLTDPADSSSVDAAEGFTYAFDFGSGYGAFGASNSATFTPPDNGNRLVRAKIRDKDGGEREYTAIVAVANVAPTATITGPTAGVEGTSVVLSSGVIDPGAADVAAGFAYAWTVTRSRDGGATWQAYATATGASLTLNPDDDGLYRVVLVATDKDGASSLAASHDVAIDDVAASNLVLTRSASQVDENAVFTLSGTFDDPGALDAHTVRIEWGDGSPDTILSLAAGVLTFSASHVYKDNLPGPGTPDYSITARVSDASQAGLPRSLFYGGPNSVVQSAPDATGVTTVIASAGFVRDVEIDEAGGKIYWADATNPGGSNQLYRANLDGSGRETLATVNSGIGGVGLDLAAGKVYFGSIYGLYQANLDGTGLVQLLSGYLFNDVEVISDKVYWSNVYGINRANLDGTGMESVVAGQQSIVGMDVVESLGRIFWADQSSGLVQSATLDGTGVVTIATGQGGARGIVVDTASETVYWGRGYTLKSSALDGSNSQYLGSVGVDILTLQIAGGAVAGGVSASTSITVLNVAPTPTIDSVGSTRVEATPIAVGGGATDPSPVDSTSLVLDWSVTKQGDSSPFATGTGASWSFTPDDDGTYVLTLTATDKDGGSRSVSQSIVVANLDPTAVDDAASTDEDQAVTIDVLANDTDPAGANDPRAVTSVSQGSHGTVVLNPDGTLTYTPAANFSGSDTFTYTIGDGDGGTATGVVVVTVAAVADDPTLSAAGDGGDEGTAIAVSIAPGLVDDDGSEVLLPIRVRGVPLGATFNRGAWVGTYGGLDVWEIATADLAGLTLTVPDGPASVSLSITAFARESSNLSTAETSVTLTFAVANVAPTATLQAPSTVDEGSPLVVSLASPDDLSAPDVAAGFTYAFDFGDGYGAFGPSSSASVTPGNNGVRTVRAKIRDKDGGEREYTATVNVLNVAPTPSIDSPVPATSPEGTAIVVDGSATDPSMDDTAAGLALTWSVTKDGSPFASGAGAGFSFTPDDDGVYVVTLTATDQDGGSSSVSRTVQVTNVAPTVATFVGATLNEGDDYTSSGTFGDPGIADTWTATVDYGDGTGVQPLALDGQGFGFLHRFDRNGTFTVTVVVTDDDGGSHQRTSTVTVLNVAPTPSIDTPLPATSPEGTAIVVSGSATDPSMDDTAAGLALSWGVTKDGSPFASGAGAGFSFTPDDDGVYVVTLTATDQDGGSSSVSRTVQATNVAPTVATFAGATLDEGDDYTSSGTFGDPGSADTWTATVDYGDGSGVQPLALNGQGFGLLHRYDRNGTFTVTVVVTDDDGGSHQRTSTVTVLNVAPTPSIDSPVPATSPEGTAIVVDGSATDPSMDDTAAGLALTWGVTKDGSPFASGAGAGFSFTPDDDGVYVVTLTATDQDGGSSSVSRTVQVTNVAPTAEILGSGTGVEGTAIVLGSQVSDPSGPDTAAGFALAWTVQRSRDGGLTFQPYGSGTGGSITINPDDDGIYRVELTATDKDGATGPTASRDIVVGNVKPTASGAGDATGVTGQPRSLLVSASDVSAADHAAGYTFLVDWGDGSPVETFGPGLSSRTASHVYTTTGVFTQTVRAVDKDGGVSDPVTRVITIGSFAFQADPCDPSKTALVIGGTAGNDTIVVNPGGGQNSIQFIVNGVATQVSPPSGHILVYGGQGNDFIQVAGGVGIPTFLFGGDGDDEIKGTNAPNVIVGGAGQDSLTGGNDRDVIIGGLGADNLNGGAGDDLLIGGTTDHDDDLAALCAIMDEWSSSLSYATRVARLTDPGGLLADGRVWDDLAVNVLQGSSGQDLYFASLLDNANPTSAEIVKRPRRRN